MKRLGLLAAFLMTAFSAFAQTSAITATITDPDSQTWNNGTYIATFVPAPFTQQPSTCNGSASFTKQFRGSLNGSGVLSVSVCDNGFVSPPGSTWQFTLCPNASAPCQNASQFVTGASPNLSTQLSNQLIAPRFAPGTTSFGYLDAEVITPVNPGNVYFNVTAGTQKTWNGSAWVTSGGSGTVNSVNSGTGTNIGGTPTAPVVNLVVPVTRANGGLNSTSAGTGLLRDGATPTASELSGDCTTSGSNAATCTKTNGTAFGTFATANAATPPAIGGTTPAAVSATTLNFGQTRTDEIDASAPQYLTGTAGTCVPGTSDNICIANAIAAIPGNVQAGTGGYGIINAMGLPQSQAWPAVINNGWSTPFANIISNGTLNFTGPQKCGIIKFNGGSSAAIAGTLVLPRCWFAEFIGSRGEVQNFVASSSWPSTYTTGTVTTTGCNNPNCTTGGGSLIASGMYQYTVTGSGTTFTTNVVPGEIFAVCTPTITGASCGGTTGTASYGMVLAVNSNTSLTIGCDRSTACTPNGSGVNYVIYAPLVMLGTMNQTGSDAGGAFTGWTGGTLNCAVKAGCATVMANYSQQENTFVRGVTFNSWINIGLDIEDQSFNSGPYDSLIFNGSSTLAANSMAIVNRVSPASSTPRPVEHFTIALDNSPANVPNYAVDWESGGELWDGHYENNTQTSTSTINYVALGDNSGAIDIVTCPIICIAPANAANGAFIHGLNTTGFGQTGIVIGTAAATEFALADLNFVWTNAFIDNNRGCTQVNTAGDGNVLFYTRSQNGTWFGTAGAAGNECASSQRGWDLTSAMSAQTVATQQPLSTGRKGTDVVTFGTTTITSATAAFTQADVNQWFVCVACGAAGANLVTQIASVTNATTAVMTTAATSSTSGMSWYFAMSFPLTASKYYKLRCDIPVTFAASATIALGFTGTTNPTSYDLSFWGNIGAAGVFKQVDFTGQTTWVSGSTNSGASGASSGATGRMHFEAGILNSATTQVITLGTVANGTNSITVAGRTDCTLQQIN